MSDPWTILTSISPWEVLAPLALAAGFAAAALALASWLRLGTDVLSGRYPPVPIRAGLGAAALMALLESSTLGSASWPGWVMVLGFAGMVGLVRAWAPTIPKPVALPAALPDAMPSGAAASENGPARRAA